MGNRNRIDHVNDQFYRRHLYGDAASFLNNPASNRQALIERMYMRILGELASNRFKWSNLPDTIDARFLEVTLFRSALSVFFKDEGTDAFLAMAGSPNGNLNMYGNPTAFTVVGNRFVGRTISAADAVPIWANFMRIPDIDIVMIYASKFAELDRTIEINSKNARIPKVIVTNENQRLSAENIRRMIDEGQPHITVSQGIGDMVSALDLGVNPDTIEKLHIIRTRLWNECMGLLGINNANQDKKERLVSDEVDANNDQVAASRRVNLNAREFAADEINKRFGLNISVCYHSESDGTDSVPALGGGSDNGNVYDTAETGN